MFNEQVAAFIFKKKFPGYKILGCVKYKDGYVFSFVEEGKEEERFIGNTVFVNGKTKKIEGFSIPKQGPDFFKAAHESQIDVSTLL